MFVECGLVKELDLASGALTENVNFQKHFGRYGIFGSE
ncbi:unannotated protein [freshwater metagenome]|uniref:Unannotated protein n=1 Tax=freshwater metagenome TaxID=449393 RepID=A0A6J6V3S7_9ZZZZ